MTGTVLRLSGVTKVFGKQVRAVDDLSLEVEEGEFFGLLGASGCGKTTTLRLIAGLEAPDGGEIAYQGAVVACQRTGAWVPPEKRQMGMVFQSYAIWPHLTVFENVAYPLRIRRLKPQAIREKVAAALEMLGLAGLGDRPAPQLSGGQQQRVALARALVHEPRLLLLDEPFSNLDAGLREQTRIEMKLLQRRLGVTVILVTHDQTEALSVCNRIAVMRAGRCEQVGSPRALYASPATAYVRDFLGRIAVLEGTVEAAAGAAEIRVRLRESGEVLVSRGLLDGAPPAVAAAATLAIRPEHIRLGATPNGHRAANTLPGQVEALLFMGHLTEARVTLAGGRSVLVPLAPGQDVEEGQAVTLEFPPEHLKLWRP
ncbi:MAG TPA: ABC transporter ATP-binding protein [Chloroflexota bacterium]|jgi:ABC-type Fe3+/spermidine/putrescine transport system ATPase subunit